MYISKYSAQRKQQTKFKWQDQQDSSGTSILNTEEGGHQNTPWALIKVNVFVESELERS